MFQIWQKASIIYQMNDLKKTRTPQDSDKYIVRFPEGMRDKIAEAAKANNRSMNAEIIARLETSIAISEKGPTEVMKEMMAKLDEVHAELIEAAHGVADSGSDMNKILKSVLIRSEMALQEAVKAIEIQDTSPATLAKFQRELAGLQFFIEGLD